MIGQEISSDFSIASRLAWLKSDHIPAAPVRLTSTPGAATPARSDLRPSAAATIPLASRPAPATITAVWPSRDIEAPGRGGVTFFTAELAASVRSTRATVRRKAGSATVALCECTATWRA